MSRQLMATTKMTATWPGRPRARSGFLGVVVEHIVGIAHLALVGHTGQLHLIEPVLPFRPARVGEHGVNVQLAGLVLGQASKIK